MRTMDIIYLVEEFYVIEAMSAIISAKEYGGFEPMRHSHSRWYREFSNFRDEYIRKLASVIYDYTVLVVASELRHCKQKASHYISDYYDSDQNRDKVYSECLIYKPSDILEAGVRLFDKCIVKWRRQYGGPKWQQIAKAGLMKDKVSDLVFIDHCVDLSHNSSVYFDKGAGIFLLRHSGEYKIILNQKRDREPDFLVSRTQGSILNQLLRRAINLGIVRVQASKEASQCGRDIAESLLLSYQPITWGITRLDYSDKNVCINAAIISSGDERECGDDYKKCA